MRELGIYDKFKLQRSYRSASEVPFRSLTDCLMLLRGGTPILTALLYQGQRWVREGIIYSGFYAALRLSLYTDF